MTRGAWGLVWALCAGCAPALQPIHTEAVAQQEGTPQDADAIYAELRKLVKAINSEPSGERRAEMATKAVELGQRCGLAAPGSAQCDYGLALALGAQARERPATAHDGLPLMAERLQKAAATDPSLDHAGPERVLGLLQVRAPGWPTGPGDPESGLENARKAATRAPGYAPNWLAVAEAADAMGDAHARREAAQKAVALAEQAAGAGEPDAATWQRDAQQLLGK